MNQGAEMDQDNPNNIEIDFKSAVEFLEKKGAQLVCPVCGKSNGWSVIAKNESEDPGLASTVTYRNNGINISGMLLVPVVCNNCGFVRHHAAGLIENWIKSGKQ